MSGVSQCWYNQVSSFTLFSTIIHALREVVEESKEKSTKQVRNKQQLPLDENKEYTSSREIQQQMRKGGNSKFSQRFNMMSTDMNQSTASNSALQTPERQMTPSTTNSDISVDENQWIKRPPLQSIYDPSKAEDPSEIYKKMSPLELGTVHDYLNLWSKNIQTLLDKLRDTIPGEGMIGEVHYWRDMSRILEAINTEVKQNYVEISMQILANSDDKSIMSSLEKFTKEKSRVIQGAKEARWNNKYMKVIEKPVQQIEQARELRDIQLVIVVLLKSLKNIYENSNFYKEARIVSFIDRLMGTIIAKVRTRVNIPIAIQRGARDYENFQQEIQQAQTVIQKFQENFWIRELMQNNIEKQISQDQANSNENPMNQSFYSKNNLDFLYFARPGTAYGTGSFQNSSQSMGMTQTMSGFYDSKTQSVKPIEMINSKKNTPKLITQMWIDRAEKIVKQLEHMNKLLEFLTYASLISFRIAQEYIPGLREEKDKLQKLRKNDLVREMKQFLELYQTYQTEYDYFDHKNQATFSYFIEKFETKAQELENKFTKITKAFSERDNQSDAFNSTQQSFKSSFKLGNQEQELNQSNTLTSSTSATPLSSLKTSNLLQQKPKIMGTFKGQPVTLKGKGGSKPILPSLAHLKSSHLSGLGASGGVLTLNPSNNTNESLQKQKTIAEQIEEYKQSQINKDDTEEIKSSNNKQQIEKQDDLEDLNDRRDDLDDQIEEEVKENDYLDEQDDDADNPFMCSASWKIS
eukprot:403358341